MIHTLLKCAKKRDETTGVETSYHDLRTGKKKPVTTGDSGKVSKLSRNYPNEGATKAAAKAEQSRAARQPVKPSFKLALARPDL